MSKTKKVKFIFGIHCHQPVGNFEHVFHEAYERSYLPFIQAMDAHPRIKFAIHYSGILYDWFMDKHPEFIDYLKKLVKRGQAEVITAGYYEPIIPIIPEADKINQINLSNDFIKEKFGVAPHGLWLTERIWEPHLPKALAQAGIDYVMVDDSHFLSAGIPKDKMNGYYVTEEEGYTVKIFPINKNLRYLIPFKLPEETIKYLHTLADESGSSAAILADDGEKFGVWPGTYKWVFEEGYLEKLLTLLEENASWIEFMTPSQYLEEAQPIGQVYLPTASYHEMMQWSLPTESGKKLARIMEDIRHQGKEEEYSQFFKGGFFRNFFVKYPESNNMHKKMLQISHRLETLKKGKSLIGEREREGRLKEAQLSLFKGQCNCAYWHGVFGGLYLNYLRQAIYENLIKAEVQMDKYARGKDDYAEITITDFDKDGNDEVILSNSLLNLYFSPACGGALFELDYKPKYFNLLNTLARREEVYHDKIRQAVGQSSGGEHAGATSIHDIVKVKEAGLEKALVYDWYRRISLLDHFLAPETTLESFSRSSYHEVGDFTVEPYEFMPQRRGNEVMLLQRRVGRVNGQSVRLEKNVSLFAKQSIIAITYEITNLSQAPLNAWFGSEYNFAMLAGDAPDRYIEIDDHQLENKTMSGRGEINEVKSVKIVDEWKGFSVSLEPNLAATLWRFPIETVSQSESGFEKTYQSTVIMPNWKFTLPPGEKWRVKLTFKIEE